MKRYFVTTAPPLEAKCDSAFHWLNLPGGGSIIVMFEEHAAPHSSWTELPHLLEAKALPAELQAAIEGFAGIVEGDTTFRVAKKLATLNPFFHP